MGKISAYFDLNNRVSNSSLVLPAYLLFYIGLVLRFTKTDAEGFASARIVMALDLELWFIRSVLFIGIAPDLGPKLVMIRQMVCLLYEDDFPLYSYFCRQTISYYSLSSSLYSFSVMELHQDP